MVVQFPCLKCIRAVAKNHKAVQCDICDKWIHIACNNLNMYTYKKKVNNKYYTLTEFNNALNELSIKKQNLYMHLNISSLSYHHLELYNLISDMKIKMKIIEISESRLQKSKQHITNISLPNYVHEHTPTESSKGGTLLYLDKSLKYKLRRT